MLIEIKVKIELSIIRLDILLERLKQALDVVHSESRLAQDAHDFKHWPAYLEVMRNGNRTYSHRCEPTTTERRKAFRLHQSC